MEIKNINTANQAHQNKRENFVKFDQVKYCHQSTKNKTHFHLGPFSLNIHEGELLVLLGPSGSGKTTMLRVLSGLESPTQGSIHIDEEEVFNDNVNILPEKRKVGIMFQDHALFPHLTVRKNIIFGLRKLSREDQERRLYELEALLGLHDYLNRYPHELSGGQQQRVALARTLAPKPKVILLDEPLCSIDADLRSSLAGELRNVLKKTQTTAIWVTHDQSEALDLADRILVINDGKIEQIDTPWKLYNEPKTRFVADFVGDAVFLKGEVKASSILTEIGSVDCPPCLQNSKFVELMIRPDDVSAIPHDSGLCKVVKRQFFGSMQLYSIELPSQKHILVTQPSKINWPLGTKVRLTLEMKSVVAFPVS